MQSFPPKVHLNKLDKIDLKILCTLQKDGRIANKDLAERVGLTASPCLARVRRLEKLGLISRYIAMINLKKLASAVSVITLISLKGNTAKHGKNLESFLLSTGIACEVYDVNGECDYIVRFTCRSIDSFYDTLSTMIDDRSLAVEQISSYVVLRELRSFSGFDLEHLADTDPA